MISASKRGSKNPMWGKTHTAEARAKMSAAKKGRKRPPFSDETRAKLSAAKKGRKCSPEMRAKMSAIRKGEKNPRWRGGISHEPYAWTFNAELKEEVRRRDGYRCQLCGVPQAECNRRLDVHHIDYCKTNSSPVNLIALCPGCHAETNANREHWTAVFRAMAIARDIAALKEREG